MLYPMEETKSETQRTKVGAYLPLQRHPLRQSLSANLDSAFEQIRQAVGDEVILQLSERDIRGVLWDSYYDIEATVQWCLGM
jgi:HBS1 N-terminus